MAIKFGTTVSNAMLDQFETTIGTDPDLKIWDGTLPANCAAANDGTEVAHIDLPTDWMAAAASGSKAKAGTWQESSATATGTADYFRIYTSGGTCVMQGTVGTSGTDMIVDSVSFTVGQTFTINTFTLSLPV